MIVQQQAGYMNKFGSNIMDDYLEEIDGVSIEKLVKEHGSPLFVFSERTIRTNYQDMYNAFASHYGNFVFSWSYKTNYLGAICNVFHSEGAIAEVVSGFEYEKARSLGIEAKDIIFNGPYKQEFELERAFKEGAIVNLDNFDEIGLVEKITNRLKKKVKVGIRINMDSGIYPLWYKFGFNLENGQAHQAVKQIKAAKYLEMNGLHTHIGTFILDAGAYSRAADKMVDFMYNLELQENIKIDYLDLGGGIPSNNRLKGIYLPPDVSTPSIDEYALAISSVINSKINRNRNLKVFLENGRALIDDAGYLVSSIVNQKIHPDGVKSYMIDAGVNLMYTSTWYDYKVRPTQMQSGTRENYRIYGPLCMNIDVVEEAISLPDLPVGSQLVLSPMGAYNVTQWMQFITYRPTCVMIMEDGSVETIRKREALEDVTACEEMPKKFRK